MKDLKPIYILFLWNLATSGGSIWLKDNLLSSVKAKDRKILQNLKLIFESQDKDPAVPKAKAKTRIQLAEAGWGYLADHMSSPINSRSPYSSVIFSQFLGRISLFLESRSLKLADIFSPPPLPEPDEVMTKALALPLVRERLEAIRATSYNPVAGLRLAELRPQLTTIPRDILDESLIELQNQGYLTLHDLSDYPGQLTEADKKAALYLSGHPRHLIYLKVGVA
ncbi:MAG: hypothetical protein LBI10_05615 [Deltaproteobacteria bacterium]|jgi:hypothetical protein|nr:hypothetical protein [Deltaproteobacteria bacterium]